MTPSKRRGKSLESFADDRTKARYTENAEIARHNRALRAAVEEKDRRLADLERRLGLYERLDGARLDPPEWLTPRSPAAEHVGIPTLLMTDVHWDERISPAEVGGINCYDRRIAAQRVRRGFEGAAILSRDYLSGVTYQGFNLFLGGDLLSGVIHEELKETNEEQVMDSVLTVLEPLESGINLLAKEFKRVHVAAVVGNHGRNSRKPRAKHRAQDNFDYLIYKLIERDFRGRKDVTVQVADAADTMVTLYRTRYLLTHGDQFQGGSGISGLVAPLLLGTHRKTRRQAAAGQPYDIMVMGHWHQSIMFPSKGLIVGGSVVGYNEYNYVSNTEPEPPQCAFWVTTPEHGVTFSAPVFVQRRAEEGW